MAETDIPGLRRATAADAAAVAALKHAAYAPMADIAGGTPLPLLADYDEILATSEVWLVEHDDGLSAALVLQHGHDGGDATLLWSVAVTPGGQSAGLGRKLLALAETRARVAGSSRMRLYTHVSFERNRAIYRQYGYVDVGEEVVGERDPPWVIVNMEKPL